VEEMASRYGRCVPEFYTILSSSLPPWDGESSVSGWKREFPDTEVSSQYIGNSMIFVLYHNTSHPQSVNVGDVLQIWKIGAYILSSITS
jgi:hypothetical protein